MVGGVGGMGGGMVGGVGGMVCGVGGMVSESCSDQCNEIGIAAMCVCVCVCVEGRRSPHERHGCRRTLRSKAQTTDPNILFRL